MKEKRKRRHAATRVQSIVRSKRAKQQANKRREEHDAARHIQNRYRVSRARDEKQRRVKQKSAATSLQAQIRAQQSRRRVEAMRSEHNAARRIQSRVRVNQAQKRVELQAQKRTKLQAKKPIIPSSSLALVHTYSPNDGDGDGSDDGYGSAGSSHVPEPFDHMGGPNEASRDESVGDVSFSSQDFLDFLSEPGSPGGAPRATSNDRSNGVDPQSRLKSLEENEESSQVEIPNRDSNIRESDVGASQVDGNLRRGDLHSSLRKQQGKEEEATEDDVDNFANDHVNVVLNKIDQGIDSHEEIPVTDSDSNGSYFDDFDASQDHSTHGNLSENLPSVGPGESDPAHDSMTGCNTNATEDNRVDSIPSPEPREIHEDVIENEDFDMGDISEEHYSDDEYEFITEQDDDSTANFTLSYSSRPIS